jgi:hypothetical protein
MEELRKNEGLALEELEEHTVELLPDREEMTHGGFNNYNVAVAVAQQGAQAQANQGVFFNF